MNCARCGTQLQPGTSVCPACGEPVNAWPQQGVYQQSYVQYQQGQYPQGYQTPYTYGSRQPHDDGGFLGALSDLPRAFADSFSRPAEVMRGLVERRDRFSWLIVSALVLVLAFLCGMVLMRGVLGMMLRAISVLSNTPLASTDASMSQGVSYIAGRVGPMAGGIAALCQLIAMVMPAAVFMFYICVVCRVAFSWNLLTSFLTVVIHVVMGLLLVLFSGVIPLLYNVEDTVRETTRQMLMVAGAALPIHAFVHVTYFTIRSGGKTVITFLFDCVYTWAVPVVLAYFLCQKTQLPIVWVYFCIQFIDVIKVIIGAMMLRSDFWANNVVGEEKTA